MGHDGSNLDNRQRPLANDESLTPESLAQNQASMGFLAEQERLENDHVQSLQKLMHDPNRWHIDSTKTGPKVKLEFLRIPSDNPDSLINAIRFSPDGKYIAIGAMNAAYVYDVETGDKICTLRHNSTEDTSKMLLVRGVAFTPDSKKLITACEDSLIRVTMGFQDKNAVAALADRGALQVWDIASATLSRTYSGHKSEIYALDISKDDHMIASGSADRTVRLWDTESGSEIAHFTFPDTPVSVAISSNPAMLVAGSLDGTLSFWPIQGVKTDDEPKNRFKAHKSSVHSVAISKQNLLVTGSEDNTVRLWSHDPKNAVKQIKHKGIVTGVDVTSDGRWVLSVSPAQELYISNAETSEIRTVIHDHSHLWLSFAVAASPSGRHFATGGGGDFQVWSYSDN
ncbi:hypothetical protein CEP54_003703 [Fusarium duplospermum]|uniref:Uncharacterized protein n=1 Tax=Fusarium duplospermum TaxID=1325734 RepID=A0A428QMR6_9HYPO|nr:hypothetical protein CEP54_003703 [Fusarium duplospermum]